MSMLPLSAAYDIAARRDYHSKYNTQQQFNNADDSR